MLLCQLRSLAVYIGVRARLRLPSTTSSTSSVRANAPAYRQQQSEPYAVTDMGAITADPASVITDQRSPARSQPIDPQSPSLLTIPGEVRNTIFEALFELSDPIQISRNRFANRTSSCYQSRDVHGIALLRTCRQFHKEAAGVLYSRNISCLKDNPYIAGPIQWAMRWLDDIGRQSSYVRHLQIYVYNTFHDPRSAPINILPILLHVWMPNCADLEVELLPGLSPHLEHLGGDITRTAETNAASCNRQLRAIIDDSSECIKRFRTVPSTLQYVWLDFYDKVAHVNYYRTIYNKGCPLSTDNIDIIDNCAQSILAASTRSVDIRSIMRLSTIRNSILTMALSPDEGIIFDLTNRTANVDVD